MLNIDENPTFTRTVTVHVPRGKQSVEQTFDATFVALDNDEFATFDLTTAKGTKAFFERVIIDLQDVTDGDGKVLPYNTLLRDRLLSKAWSRPALFDAYNRGVTRAAEGN